MIVFRPAAIWHGRYRSAASAIVAFAALLLFTWYFATTLFLIFAGMLLGVALNAMTNLFGRVVRLPHALRLTIVCLVLAALLSGVVFLGGTTIARQATVLSDTIKSQLVTVKAFLEKKRRSTPAISTSAMPAAASASDIDRRPRPAPAATRNLARRRANSPPAAARS